MCLYFASVSNSFYYVSRFGVGSNERCTVFTTSAGRYINCVNFTQTDGYARCIDVSVWWGGLWGSGWSEGVKESGSPHLAVWPVFSPIMPCGHGWRRPLTSSVCRAPAQVTWPSPLCSGHPSPHPTPCFSTPPSPPNPRKSPSRAAWLCLHISYVIYMIFTI